MQSNPLEAGTWLHASSTWRECDPLSPGHDHRLVVYNGRDHRLVVYNLSTILL